MLDGWSRTEAATADGMDRQTLRDWAEPAKAHAMRSIVGWQAEGHRYNADGVAGLRDRPRPGRPARMSAAQVAEFDAMVETGPDVAADGVVRWRCVGLKAVVSERFGVELSERSVGRILNGRGFRRLSARPRHPRSDGATQEAFKTTSATL